MSEEQRAIQQLLEQTEQVMRRLRIRHWREREEWRADWSPITMRLYQRDCVRIDAKRERHGYRAAA